jgi:hypothetical protein
MNDELGGSTIAFGGTFPRHGILHEVVGLEALTAELHDLNKILLQLEARLAGIEAKMGETAVPDDVPASSDLDDFICDGCFKNYNAVFHGMICPLCGFDNVPF